MSDAVDVVRRWFAALAAGDPAPELCDSEVEIRNWAEFPIPGPYFGQDGVREWWADVDDAFDDMHFELESIEPIDDRSCLITPRVVGRFRLTGIDVDASWGAIVTVRDGKILSAIGYASPRRARRAAGLN